MAYKVEIGGKLYPFDEKNGAVAWLDFSWCGLGQSMDETILYVDGLEHPPYPPLGAGLDIGGDKRNWPHGATIWPDDIPVFLDRYEAFRLLGRGLEREADGRLRPLTDEERERSVEILSHPDLNPEAIERALQERQFSLGSMVSRLAYASQMAASAAPEVITVIPAS